MLSAENDEINSYQSINLDEYKRMETRLFGELMKSCQRYTNDISIISIVGILDLVKQEIKDLDKETQRFMKDFD
ncbi:MAG: hypothetical protein R6V50_06050 [Thermoplasmatota archaeon]